MAINEELLFEMNDRGEPVLVQSVESLQAVFLRFSNRTSRPVDVWWRDFNGKKRHYMTLDSGAYCDVNSFLTHPWEFSDKSTNETFVINNMPIFRAPSHIGGMQFRTNWNITVTVRTLRRTSMLALAEILPNAQAATLLDLPVTVSKELGELVVTLKNTSPIIQNDVNVQ